MAQFAESKTEPKRSFINQLKITGNYNLDDVMNCSKHDNLNTAQSVVLQDLWHTVHLCFPPGLIMSLSTDMYFFVMSYMSMSRKRLFIMVF